MHGESGRAGARIRARRADRGLSQAELARRAGISASYLNLIEHDKRPIGGRLLSQIARALGTDTTSLAEGAGADLDRALRRAAEALPADPAPETGRVEQLTTEFPGWSALIGAQSQRIAALERQVAELGDRMAHDPVLSASVHDILSAATAIRSTAAILRDGDLAAEWLARFHRNVDEDSRRLARTAQGLASYLTAGEGASHDAVSPQEEVEAWLAARDFRVTGAEEPEATGFSDQGRGALAAYLAEVRADAAALPEARLLAAFGQAGDPLALARTLGQPAGRVMRAIARLPVAAVGGPVGLVECDGSGAILFRRPVPGFEMPRYGAPCSLWPLYQVLLMPQAPRRDVLRQFGADSRPVETWCAAEIDHPEGYGGPAVARITMLILPAPDADPAPSVGATCRLCPREGCAARREAAIL